MTTSYSPAEIAWFTHLYSLNIIPLRVVLGSLTWVLCDYFSTFEDEVRYVWIAIFNGVLFLLSIIAFLVIMVQGAMRRSAMIAPAIRLPLPGCPAINGGIQWSLWVPAMIFEFVLFGFALYKSVRSLAIKTPLQDRPSLTAILVGDNILYFFGISTLLILLNIMSIGTNLIPWFSFGPLHAGLGIMTTHMLMHLRKATVDSELTELDKSSSGDPNPREIDEVIRGMDEDAPRFIVSTSTRSRSSYLSSAVSAIEVDVEQFAGSSQSTGSSSRTGAPFFDC
ncbi:hypothetical protein EST38_g8847 [Candolleomyces aberdarensis]|uniref:DUF6533 domain-containing protein n=1 Tax=Candolleomyces aberdarensis TaxID=2316362 RepID=A0A4V1Q315_9AGAR|nr:hypothetical protein EST38_g8847 [Candolleomyces aberdarensis]